MFSPNFSKTSLVEFFEFFFDFFFECFLFSFLSSYIGNRSLTFFFKVRFHYHALQKLFRKFSKFSKNVLGAESKSRCENIKRICL